MSRATRWKADRWLGIGDQSQRDALFTQASVAYTEAARAFEELGDLEQAERCARAGAAMLDRWADRMCQLADERKRRAAQRGRDA